MWHLSGSKIPHRNAATSYLHRSNRQPSSSTKRFPMLGLMSLPPVFSMTNPLPLHVPWYPLDPTTLLKLKFVDLLLHQARVTDAVPLPLSSGEGLFPSSSQILVRALARESPDFSLDNQRHSSLVGVIRVGWDTSAAFSVTSPLHTRFYLQHPFRFLNHRT